MSNVHFLPEVPLSEVSDLLAGSDALLVPLSAHPTFTQFIPSKMIDFMAVGPPPEALAGAIGWLAEHRAEADEMGRRGQEFASKRTRVVQVERLEELLFDIVPR